MALKIKTPRSPRRLRKSRQPLERTNFLVGEGVDEALLSADAFRALSVTETAGKYECAKYARLAAERFFGLRYNPADAHALGRANRVVWDEDSRKPMPKLRGGQILGIYLPGSRYLERGWRFTHVALVIRPQLNTYVIAHNTSGILRIDLLKNFLEDKEGRIMQVIAPRVIERYAPGIDLEWARKEDARIREEATGVFAGKRRKKGQ
jgi:hypothetical protein